MMDTIDRRRIILDAHMILELVSYNDMSLFDYKIKSII